MTKEELEKESEEYLKKKNYTGGYIGYFASDYCKQAYIDSAEPREKRIAELEEKISVLLFCKNCPENKGGFICVKEYENKCLAQKIQYIKELKEENKVLAQNLEDTEILNKTLVNRNAEFGYNKANEWHYVKDGDLPKEEGVYLVYISGNLLVDRWHNGKWMLHFNTYAWKEIILPELPKESE